MAKKLTIIALDSKNFSKLSKRHPNIRKDLLPKAVGLSIPKDNVAYVRITSDYHLNKAAVDHELSELLASDSAHEVDGVRYGLKQWFRRNIMRPLESIVRPRKYAGTGAAIGQVPFQMALGTIPGVGPLLATGYGAWAGRQAGRTPGSFVMGGLKGYGLGTLGAGLKEGFGAAAGKPFQYGGKTMIPGKEFAGMRGVGATGGGLETLGAYLPGAGAAVSPLAAFQKGFSGGVSPWLPGGYGVPGTPTFMGGVKESVRQIPGVGPLLAGGKTAGVSGAGGVGGAVEAGGVGGVGKLLPYVATAASLTAKPPEYTPTDYGGILEKYGYPQGRELPEATQTELLRQIKAPLSELYPVDTQKEFGRVERTINTAYDRATEQVQRRFTGAGQRWSTDVQREISNLEGQRAEELGLARGEIENRVITRAIEVKQQALSESLAQGRYDKGLALEMAKLIGVDQQLEFAIENQDYEQFQSVMGQIMSMGYNEDMMKRIIEGLRGQTATA